VTWGSAAAQHHFRVSKSVEAGLTHTRVSHLRDTRERQAELAELAGGDSGEAHSYAASLLGVEDTSEPGKGRRAA
jgi:DNA repair protein RecN (Recombination protein N)